MVFDVLVSMITFSPKGVTTVTWMLLGLKVVPRMILGRVVVNIKRVIELLGRVVVVVLVLVVVVAVVVVVAAVVIGESIISSDQGLGTGKVAEMVSVQADVAGSGVVVVGLLVTMVVVLLVMVAPTMGPEPTIVSGSLVVEPVVVVVAVVAGV